MSTYDTVQLDRVEPAYLANYGLSKSPFSDIHDDVFLYLDAERAQRLNLLQHLIQHNDLFLIVQGVWGVGKTSLLTRFITSAVDNWSICEVSANTMMDAGQLLFQIAQGFGLQQLPQGSGELQEMLYAHIAKLHHQNEIPVLVIDDAHELSRETLLAIFHLADARVDDANLLRIILFAEPQIENILSTKDIRSLRERITHTMEIPPLDEATTAEYLKHRMAVAGFNGGSPFTPRMVKRIYKASAGIPERINQLAHEILDKGDFGHEEEADAAVPEPPPRRDKTRAYITIALVVIGLLLIFQFLFNHSPETKQTRTLPIPLSEKTTGVQPQARSQSQAELQPEQTPVTGTAPDPALTQVPADTAMAEKSQVEEKIIPLHPAPATATSQTTKTSPPPDETSNQATAGEAPAVSQPTTGGQTGVEAKPAIPQLQVQNVMPNPVPASNARQTITISGEGFTRDSRVFVSWADKVSEIPAARVRAVNDKQLQVQLTVGTEHSNWQLHVVDPKHGKSNTLEFKVATAPAVKKQIQGWVLSQAPDTFTLQLFGSHDQHNAVAFIRQHKLGNQANYFVSERNGRDWYSVIYGVYPDHAAAAAAIKTLPATLQKIKPWVRRFDDIQASINGSPTPGQKPRTPAVNSAPVLSTAPPRQGDAKQYESWIWSQDPSYFTLQLLGARDADSVMKFLRDNGNLGGHAIYFHTRHDGRDWYAVVFGVYPDKQKAREAIKRLPAALQKASPWIRSFASIHAELSRTE